MANNVHGLTVKDENGKTRAHPLYWVWHEKKKKYDMCEEWRDNVMAFYEWCKENGWAKGKQVRRHNTKEPFAPENCYIYTVRKKDA